MAEQKRIHRMKLDETRALAIIFGNTRRKKRKENLVVIARAFEWLVRDCGSQRAAARKVGLSTEMIRQFLTVLKLHPEVQGLFARREIDSVDTAKDLYAIRDVRKQINLAKRIAGSTSKDARDIRRIAKRGTVSVDKAKEIVMTAKGEGLHVFMLDFDEETYGRIVREARKGRKRAPELVKAVVLDWLERQA